MNKVLFDASAILALINKEDGSDIIESYLGNICMNSINVSELYSKLLDYGMEEYEGREILDSLVTKVIDFDVELAYLAASLKKYTKHKGLSLGDRACIATGIKYKMEIYTADKSWKECEIKESIIKLIR